MAAIKKWNGLAWEETYPKTTAGNIVATGTPSASTFLRGDGAWATPPADTNNFLTGVSGSGNGTVTFTRSGLSNLTWNAAHTHAIANVTGLQTALDGKLGTLSKAFDSSSADLADKLHSFDTRGTATTPQTHNNQIQFDFKSNTTNGLSDGGTYNGVMYWRKYGSGTDWTGGGALELAYTDNGNLWKRYGTNTTWGSWNKLFADDYHPNADTLTTARTINGTSFNGGANITTANWGTARTITIGNTGKSVNGGGNVSWTLAEIGAQAAGSYAAASHNHDASHITTGTIDVARLPAIAITDVFTGTTLANFVSTVYSLDPSGLQEGDILILTTDNQTYVHNGGTAGTAADFTLLRTPTDLVTSVAGKQGVVTLVKGDVGLGNVDNTADSTKTVANANRWTSDRTITIGNTGKTVNGTGNVSWTLAEIGATNNTGTVTSVGLSLPNIFTVTNSPVTATGTLTGTLANQSANTVFAGPTTGLPGVPAFRTLVADDLPAHTHGNITNAGAIGTTANLAVITTTSGVLTTASRSGIDTRTSFPPDAHGHTIFDVADLTTELAAKEPAFTKNTGFNKNFGTTAGTVSEGNHTHAASAITSGTLAVGQGGTGQTTLALARNAMGLGNTTGALPILNGGTGAFTAPTQWGIIYANTTTQYASTAAGTFGQILRSNGTSAPTWTDSFVNISNFTSPTASNGTTAVTLSVNQSIVIGGRYAIEVSDDATSTNNRQLLFWTQQTSSSTSAAAGQTFTFTARSISTTTTITYKFVIYRTGSTSFGIINAYTHTLGTGSTSPIATTTAIRVWRIFRVV